MSGPLLLLGPQRPTPNAPAALAELSGEGPVVVITAGWRHDETDDEALRRHLGPDVAVLPLYTWFEVVMRELPELRQAYRARQDELLRLTRLYRTRLHGALRVVRDLLDQDVDAHGIEWLDHALSDVRRIDAQLLEACDAARAAHGRPWDTQPTVARLQERARVALESARAIVLTGGHVAVLRNRMAFFGVGDQLRTQHQGGKPIIAWSAGAMALTDRIVLFYDDPPDGPAFPELFDRGLGLMPGLVMLPHARQRLRLDEPRRVELLARRLAPDPCLGLMNGAWLVRGEAGWSNRGEPGTAVWLRPDGQVEPLPEVP